MASIYQDIAERTGGDIYLGVVGPVRSGKSTLIQQFMEKLILPHMEDENAVVRARDEMPQSASGKTVMTTEPKFIPEDGVSVTIDHSGVIRMKMIDCVGYVVDGAEGLREDDQPRMVMTPWSSQALPFETAAELGTKKVIREHATIGILVTADGSFGELKRNAYEEAERKVVSELNATGKPYVIVLNSQSPESQSAITLARALQEEYGKPVCCLNCFTMTEAEIQKILAAALMEFRVKQISLTLPRWILNLEDDNSTKKELLDSLAQTAKQIEKMSQLSGGIPVSTPTLREIQIRRMDYSDGSVYAVAEAQEGLFYHVLGERSGLLIHDESDLLSTLEELNQTRVKYDKIRKALEMAEATGYGIVVPTTEDITLEDPEVVKHPGGHGIRFKATAPSIHMIKANVETQLSPIIGNEKQSEEMARYITEQIDKEPEKVWELNMFGKSLNDLINEELNSKLEKMPEDARGKFVDMLQKIINDGSGGLICIIL